MHSRARRRHHLLPWQQREHTTGMLQAEAELCLLLFGAGREKDPPADTNKRPPAPPPGAVVHGAGCGGAGACGVGGELWVSVKQCVGDVENRHPSAQQRRAAQTNTGKGKGKGQGQGQG